VGCLFFDAKGRPSNCRFDLRTIGISHDELLRVPVRVGLASGLDKLDAVHALVRGKILDVLIIDTALARKLDQATKEA
jgi:deoxyribonucleoside regulator